MYDPWGTKNFFRGQWEVFDSLNTIFLWNGVEWVEI